MNESEMHERAQHVFAGVMAQVTDDDLAAPTPCSEWTVADLLDHVLDGNRVTAKRMGESLPRPRLRTYVCMLVAEVVSSTPRTRSPTRGTPSRWSTSTKSTTCFVLRPDI